MDQLEVSLKGLTEAKVVQKVGLYTQGVHSEASVLDALYRLYKDKLYQALKLRTQESLFPS